MDFMGISMNGPSGINTASIIDQLVALEQQKVTAVQKKIDDYQVKIDAYSQLKSLVSALGTSALELNKDEDFNIFGTSSSNEDLVTFSAGVGAVEGSYDISVFQVAASEKMISADNLIAIQTTALSTYGITPGDISINGVSITVDADDTIQDLRMKINNAVDSEGNRIGVSATVLKVSDSNFRLLLTSTEKGAAGAEYEDLTGSVLQDLGIITDALGTKGSTNQTLESDIDFQAAFDALAAGQSIEFAGKDRDGNVISESYVKGTASTVQSFIDRISRAFNGMIDASVDGTTGKLTIADKVTGTSSLSISSFSVGGVSSDIDITAAGDEGAGVLSTGKDSFYSVDGIYLQSDSTSPEGVIAGVTLDFHKASVSESIHLEMSRDFGAITKKVKELFNNYNAIVRFVNEKTQYSVEESKDGSSSSDKVIKGDLAADMTVRTIVSQIRSVFQQQFSLTGSSIDNLALIGIKTDPKTGELNLDEKVFTDKLKEDFNGVTSLFVTKGFSENANVTMGRFTKDTANGRYLVEEVDADHVRMQLEGSTDWYTSDARVGEVVTFSDGPVKGLSLSVAQGILGAGEYFTFSKGIADQVNEMTTGLTDVRDGLISMRQETWNGSIDRSEDRIIRIEASIEDYRLRLVKQFSQMEQNLNSMQSQSANMLSALGYSR
jgi:flagellar capping protein FliD